MGIGRNLRRKFAAFALGLCLAVITLLLIELAFFALNRFKDDGIESEDPYLFAFDEALGYRPLANAEAPAYKKHNGKTLFEVTYRTDAFGRRATPPQKCDSPPENFIAFFGGSFTFGHGLNDDETLPAQTQHFLPAHRAYNYGFSGYGPQQALVKIQSGTLSDEMPESNGTAVYVFMGHHIHRAIGSMRVWTQWGRHFPYFTLDDNGRLEHLGTFLSGRPTRSAIYNILKRDQVLEYFEVDIPLAINADHLQLTAEILHETDEAFREQYPEGRFVVLIYPASTQIRFDRTRFVGMLRHRNIDVLDASTLVDMTDARYHIPFDDHPTAEANAQVAAAIAAHLTKTDG